ncbi:MAG: hypothetical protein ABR510_02855 [Trueperaceae bacterium]
MSRTARILIAILLLAAAAFFWVNFYTQSRTGELPTPTDVVTADGTEPTTPETADADAVPEVADADADAVPEVADADTIGEVDPEAAPVGSAPVIDADGAGDASPDGDAAEIADAEATELTEAEANGEPAGDGAADVEPVTDADPVVDAEAPLVVAPADDGPPTVVVDAPVVGREIVIADLPFLVTEPRPADAEVPEAEVVEGEIARGVTIPTRTTINPFSPVVVRTPPAPERAVPETASVVGEVAVPTGPTPAEVAAAEAAARASAPTPRAITPGSPGDTAALRPLPTGSVLSATPELLREPRVGTVAEEVDFATVTTIAVPEAEQADLAPSESQPAQAEAPDDVEPLTSSTTEAGAETATETPATADAPPPPLAAGATRLARFLRDQNYSFTGSVLGPVGIGVFRSDLDMDPVVVALGQTLPETEIVLTDLRGQQAELRLGDSTQILTLDLRR